MSDIAIKYAFEKGYRVKEGKLVNPKGKELSVRKNSVGYYETNIRINGKLYHLPVHRLCAYQKYGESLFSADCVRHLDGNKLNNKSDNIGIGSQSENMMDKPELVRKNSAIKATYSKKDCYDEDFINKVRAFHISEKSYKKTMEKFGITSKGTLHHILNKRVI